MNKFTRAGEKALPKTFATKPDPALVSSKPLFVNIDIASRREGVKHQVYRPNFVRWQPRPGRSIPLSIICSIWLTTNKDNLLLGIFQMALWPTIHKFQNWVRIFD